MNTFQLLISSPDGNIFDEHIHQIILRGVEGDLAVMAGHTPFITPVKPCDCYIELKDETIKNGHLESGLLTVSDNTATLITGNFKWL